MDCSDIAKYMVERQSILLRRRQGLPGPWTTDPILQNNRFCNVFREDDRVTIWIRENIREPFADHPNLWFMLAIARYINWPPTLNALIHTPGAWPSDNNFDPQSMTDVLEGLARDKVKVYTGAYMIRAESDPRTRWYTWTKHQYISEVVLGKLWTDRNKIQTKLEACTTLEAAWGIVQEHHYTGWGPFMAYEWVTDLRHTRYLRNATDIMTWANAGPGAIRGLNRLHGRYINTHPASTQTCSEMQELLLALNHYNEAGFNAVFGGPYDPNGLKPPRFEMRDIEHTLCEFDKVQRVKLGQGKMRARYDWTKTTKL